MTKLYIKYTLIVIAIGILVYSLYNIDLSKYIQPRENPSQYQIDSLKNIIRVNNIIINRDTHLIDSLLTHKTQIINSYETTIKNYSNPTLVSDDSISSYISKELYNWK